MNMLRDGKEVKEEVRCWCGATAYFNHVASTSRKDGKKTVIYKCISNHTTFEEINDPNKRFVKVKEKKVKSKPSKVETPETNTD